MGIVNDNLTVVVDESNNKAKNSNYKPGPAIGEIIALHGADLEPARPIIRAVVGALLPLSPDRMWQPETCLRRPPSPRGSPPWDADWQPAPHRPACVVTTGLVPVGR
jgi:hypothetical protein